MGARNIEPQQGEAKGKSRPRTLPAQNLSTAENSSTGHVGAKCLTTIAREPKQHCGHSTARPSFDRAEVT